MSTSSRPGILGFLAAAVFLLPSAAKGQGAIVEGVVLHAAHPVLHQPLYGGLVGYRFRKADASQFVSVGLEWLRGNSTYRVDANCNPPYDASVCPMEPINDKSEYVSLVIAAERVLSTRGTLPTLLTGSIAPGRLAIDSRGQSTGSVLTATKPVVRVDVGLSTMWAASSWTRLALQGRISGGLLLPIITETRLNGSYSPVEHPLGTLRLGFGLIWRSTQH